MPDKYHIRDGYRAGSANATVERNFGDYWIPERRDKSERYQWYVYAEARRLAEEHSLRSVADFGCGIGEKLDRFLGHLAPLGLDQPTVGPFLARERPRLAFRPIDLEAPTDEIAEGETFDLTICADVLEHLLDPDPTMALLKRCTGRFCVLSTPERDLVRGPGSVGGEKREHVREWAKDEFASYVESRGFKILRHDLTPQERLDKAEAAEREASTEPTARWLGCQLLVCTPA